jgi:nucleoside-diphosphate-sugar epimerase/predicted dehydrogenase
MTQELRPLVLGAGAVVHEYIVAALDNLDVVARAQAIDRPGEAIDRLRQIHPRLAVRLDDFQTALNTPDLSSRFNAAIVALPNSFHEAAVLRSLERGLHVLCEKPLALSGEVCTRLARCADRAGRTLAVNMVRRLLPSVLAIREAFREGLIGELIEISAEDGAPYAWMSESGAFFQPENGGVLADMGAHYLDLIQWLVGDLTPMRYADDSLGGVEANATYELRGPTGVPVRLALSRTRTLRNSVVFTGSRGELVLEKDVFDSATWHPAGKGMEAQIRPTQSFESGDWPPTLHACFVEQIYRFTRAVSGKVVPLVSAKDAASTVGLIERAYAQRPVRTIMRSGPMEAGRPHLEPAQTLITGGTGFIGSRLVRRLTELGFDRVVVPVRNYRTCANAATCSITMPRVDLLDAEQVRAAMRGTRYVVHLAYGREGPESTRVTVLGTRNVVEAAIAAGCESVVILSTMYVFGQPAGVTVDEMWPYRPSGGAYGRDKAYVEQWCLQRSTTAAGTRIVVLNPTCVYGPGGKTYTELPLRMAREGTFCWIDGGRGVANVTYVDNVVDAIILALPCAVAHGQRLIINDCTTTWRTFLMPLLGPIANQIPSYSRRELLEMERRLPRDGWLDLIRIVLSDPRATAIVKRSHVYRTVLALAGRRRAQVIERARSFRRSPRLADDVVYPPSWLGDLFGPASTIFSAAKARSRLGWRPRVGLEEGQVLTRQWLTDSALA